jgi:hypothetical protein
MAVDDIIFGGTTSGDTSDFVLEIPPIVGGVISSYSLDGESYDYISGGEVVSIIIN